MKYKVGDKVLIRQWDDMVEEFGLDDVGDISVGQSASYIMQMKQYCGTIQKIKDIKTTYRTGAYVLKDIDCYRFTDEMIERKVDIMIKDDLKTGHIVTTRNGMELEVYLNIDTARCDANNVLVNASSADWLNLESYNDDLTMEEGLSGYDIVQVDRIRHPYALQNMNYEKQERIVIWKREEPEEMTVAEIEKRLGYPVKIVKE